MSYKLNNIANEPVLGFYSDKTLLAKISLDPMLQIRSLVLFKITDLEKRTILELCAHHILTYVKMRSHVKSKTALVPRTVDNNPKLTSEDSSKAFNKKDISSELKSAEITELYKVFESFDVPVIHATATTIKQALNKVCANKRLKEFGLTYSIVEIENPLYAAFKENVLVQFKLANKEFEFWYNLSTPDPNSSDLYIVPGYHPVMQGAERKYMINGSTAALTRTAVVESIYPPYEACVNEDYRRSMSAWNYINHPYKAKGKSVIMAISNIALLSTEGMQELVQILSDALRIDNRYICVNGGFSAPYKIPFNHVQNRNSTRGSEDHCVWMYHILESEGELEGSYIPAWFMTEKWLEAYAAAVQ